jgi:hypothetical protein
MSNSLTPVVAEKGDSLFVPEKMPEFDGFCRARELRRPLSVEIREVEIEIVRRPVCAVQ